MKKVLLPLIIGLWLPGYIPVHAQGFRIVNDAGTAKLEAGTYSVLSVVGTPVATNGHTLLLRQVLRRKQVGEAQESVSGQLPGMFSLEANYPNPFNPTTTFQFSLPETRRVTLQVFDLLGRLVKTLVDEVKISGQHQVVFDASELPSGMYLYRIKAGPYEQTRKMVLLR